MRLMTNAMDKQRYLALLWFSAILYSYVRGSLFDCPYTECVCARPQIYCQNQHLNSVPAFNTTSTFGYTFLIMDTAEITIVYSNAALNAPASSKVFEKWRQSLIISNAALENNITTIQAHALAGNMTDISLLKNPISVIDDAAFDDSKNTLKSVAFSAGRFTRVPDALLSLRVLQYFHIYDTVIQDWNVDAMKSMGSTVEILYLVNVSLSTWPTWIQYFPHLTELSLGSNSVSFIPDDALDTLSHKLTTIDLSKNNLMTVSKTFSNQKALQILNLGYNKISNVTWLPQSSKLQDLTLIYNNITDAQHLSDALRPSANTLTDLNIYGNQLTEIPDLSFLELMYSLDLTHNYISNPNSGSMPFGTLVLTLNYNSLPAIPRIFFSLYSVTSLVMSYNAVTEIRASDVPIWLDEIQLEYNLVVELTDTSFPNNSRISSLDLLSNPIVKISEHAFDNLRRLAMLDLQNSKLTRLPLALSSLSILNLLELTGSTDLVCTCTESSLGPWILNSHITIRGQCGETNIHDFFAILSQSCPT